MSAGEQLHSGTSLLFRQLLNVAEATQKDVADLRRDVAVINVILKGPNGDNGINGRLQTVENSVRELHESFDTATKTIADYWDHRREDTCYGISALKTYQSGLVADKKQADAVKSQTVKEKRRQDSQVRVALIMALAAIFTTMITTGASLFANTNQRSAASASTPSVNNEVLNDN